MASSALSPRAQEIAAAARDLLDEEGPDALTMRRVAERLEIRAPSLYKHLAGKEALEAAVISGGFIELTEAFEQAMTDAKNPLGALAAAYRAFALRRPHLYRLMTERPLRRDLLEPHVEERAAEPLLRAVGGDASLARAVWAFAHGMTILELNGRFPAGADLDAAWLEGLRGFRRA